jgi:hypothetical protein
MTAVGLQWRVAGAEDHEQRERAPYLICNIHGMAALVQESYFGGIVAQPFVGDEIFKDKTDVVDISRAPKNREKK